MYSTINSLKVYVSPLLGQTVIDNVDNLLEGELGFFNKSTGALISDGIGEGYFALKKEGIVLKSKVLTFAGWAAELTSYAAPTLRSADVVIPTPVVGENYQLNVEVKIPGMRGEYFYQGNHVAVTGDTAIIVATALVTTINQQLVREGKINYLTISNVASSSATITIASVLQDYRQGKFRGKPADFRARMTLPEDQALLESNVTAGLDGVGYGPYIAELEYLAQGDSDPHRLIAWRNNFDWIGNATAAGQYNVVVLKEENQLLTANARVDAPMEYIIAFNSAGITPSPIIDESSDGDTTVTGVAFPGSSVILSVDGSPESAVLAHAVTGVYTVTVTVATGEVLTATAQSGVLGVSAVSNALTVIA